MTDDNNICYRCIYFCAIIGFVLIFFCFSFTYKYQTFNGSVIFGKIIPNSSNTSYILDLYATNDKQLNNYCKYDEYSSGSYNELEYIYTDILNKNVKWIIHNSNCKEYDEDKLHIMNYVSFMKILGFIIIILIDIALIISLKTINDLYNLSLLHIGIFWLFSDYLNKTYESN